VSSYSEAEKRCREHSAQLAYIPPTLDKTFTDFYHNRLKGIVVQCYDTSLPVF